MLTLTAQTRTQFGKKLGSSREKGLVPVVLYGPKEKNIPAFVDLKEFLKVWREAGESSVISLHTDAGEKDVLIHEVALDPLRDTPIHVDFYAIESGKKLRVKVPLEFTGVSPAVKSLSGVLVKVLHEVEVEAMPRSLPHALAVDLGKLATFEDRILVKDIPSGKDVAIVFPAGDEIIALVAPPKEEKEEEAAPVDLSAIEVEKKGKKEEEGAPGAEASAPKEKAPGAKEKQGK